MRNHFVDLGCTPYFIGPIPFLSYRETEPIFVGLVSGDKSDSVSTPAGGQNNGTGVNENGSTFKSKISNSAFSRGSVITQNNPLDIKTSCSNTDTGAGVNIDAFNTALSNLKGNYDFIGNYLCDQKGNCGRPLGSTQFMSYNPDVRKIINSKPGGSDFLARLDAGKQVTTAEMLEFFTVREQKRLTQAKTNKLLDIASQKIDPYTGQKNVGERLLENAVQMHFAGTAIPPDIEIINSLTQESSQNYGEKITRKYSQIINSNNCL